MFVVVVVVVVMSLAGVAKESGLLKERRRTLFNNLRSRGDALFRPPSD